VSSAAWCRFRRQQWGGKLFVEGEKILNSLTVTGEGLGAIAAFYGSV
jgi:hypothetical protein